MKQLFALVILVTFSVGAYAQLDSITPANAVAVVRPDSEIYAEYSYYTKYISSDLTLYKDSTYSYGSYGCSWWHSETGKWKVKNSVILVLKMEAFKDKNKTRKKVFLRRHKLSYSESAVIARAIRLDREKKP